MTPAEVAAVFRVDPKTVTRWAKTGKLDSIRTLGGVRRYYADQVAGFLDATRSDPASQPGTPDHGSAASLPDAAAVPAWPDHPARPPARRGRRDGTGRWVTAAQPPNQDTASTPGPRTPAPRLRPGMPAFRAPEEPPSSSP